MNYPAIEATGFGQTSVTIAGRTIAESEWSSLKSKEMLFLFLTARQPLSRDQCCAALWPDFDQSRATSNFHSTLYRLRSATYFDIISSTNGRYRLNPLGSFASDVGTFEELVRDTEETGPSDSSRIDVLERAVRLYHGPFGPDFYSDWAENLRQRLEDRYLRALATLATYYFGASVFGKALEFADLILEVDDLNDEALCLKIESFLNLGDRLSALRHYQSYRRYLEQEASTPSARFRQLGGKIATTRV
jgi:two-component SAPR family response regulator